MSFLHQRRPDALFPGHRNALGVPNNQARMFLDETTTRAYAEDTLDPVAATTHIASGAYHYQCVQPFYSVYDSF